MDFSVGDKVLYANRGVCDLLRLSSPELLSHSRSFSLIAVFEFMKLGRWKGGDVQARDFLLL